MIKMEGDSEKNKEQLRNVSLKNLDNQDAKKDDSITTDFHIT